MKEEVDICIVGGGVVGMFCALAQAKRGKTVRLIDKLYSGSSRHNIGDIILRGMDESTLSFMKFSMDAWKEAPLKYSENFGFEERPSAYFAYTEEELIKLEQEVELDRSFGFDSKIVNDRLKIQSALNIPRLPDGILGAKFSTEGGTIDTSYAMDALRQTVIKSGVRIWGSDEVTKVITEGNTVKGVRIATGEECYAGVTIIATGVWSNNILKSIDAEIPIRPARTHLIEASPTGSITNHMLVRPGKYGDILMRPLRNGRVMISYSARMDQAQATWSTQPDLHCVEWLKSRVGDMQKSLEFARFQDPQVVSTAITPDGHSYLGKVPKWENLLIGVGFNGKSYAYAAGVAKLLTLITDGDDFPKEIDEAAFSINSKRFSESGEKRRKRMEETRRRLMEKRAKEKAEKERQAAEAEAEAEAHHKAEEEPESKAKNDSEDNDKPEEWVDPFKRS